MISSWSKTIQSALACGPRVLFLPTKQSARPIYSHDNATWKSSIGYRLRWRSDIWSTNRGAAEVGTPDIRPTTEDDIRHNATTQDKDLLRIIMPFCFRFYFHYRMLRKKAKQPFEASSLKFF